MIQLLKTPAAILALFALLLVSCDKEDEAKDHLDKGVEYFKKGEYEKSALELKTSSQADKNTADSYYYLALLDEKNRQFKNMKENLTKAIELEPKKDEARIKLGKLQLLFGDFNAALEQVQEVLKNTPQNQEALLLRASVFLRQKKQTDALTIINELLKSNPNYVDALTLKAVITGMDANKLDEAINLIDTALKNDLKNIDLHLFKIQLNHKKNNIEAVINGYKELINLYPEKNEFKIALAREHAQNKQTKEAEEILQNLADNEKNDVKLKFLLMNFLSDTISGAKAEEQFQQYIEKYKDQPRMLLNLSKWMIAKKNYPEAKKVLDRVVELEEDTDIALAAKTLLAKMALENKDLDQTQNIVNDILKTNSNYNDAKILLARILILQKKYPEATKQLTEVTWNLPNSEETLQLLGQISVITSDQKQADKYFENLLQVNPGNTEAVIFTQNNALRKNDLKYAQSILEKGLTYNPNNLLLLEKLVKLHLNAKNWDAAKISIQKITDIPNDSAKDLAKFLTAESFKTQGNCAKAIELFRDMVLQFPGNIDILHNLTNCYEMQNQRAEAIKFLSDLAAKNSSDVTTNIALGHLLLKDQQFDKISKLLDNFKNNPYPDWYILLAELKLAQKDTQGAITAYQDGLKNYPENVALSLALASFHKQQGNFDLAASQYEALLAKSPTIEVATNNLASLLIEHNPEKINQAVQLAEKFKDSTTPDFLDTYAWGLTKQGKVSEAINIFNKIITIAPDVPIYRYHLGFAQHKNGNTALAIAELSQALELSKTQGGFQGKQAAEMLLNDISNRMK